MLRYVCQEYKMSSRQINLESNYQHFSFTCVIGLVFQEVLSGEILSARHKRLELGKARSLEDSRRAPRLEMLHAMQNSHWDMHAVELRHGGNHMFVFVNDDVVGFQGRGAQFYSRDLILQIRLFFVFNSSHFAHH